MATSLNQEGCDEGTDVTYTEWIDVQKKTFTNWVNEKLKGTPYKVEVLEKDLDDGVTLIKLLETLANKKMHKRYYHSTPLPQQLLMPCWTTHQSLQCCTTASHPITYIHTSIINFISIFFIFSYMYIPPPSPCYFLCPFLSHVSNSIPLSHVLF